MRPRELSTHLSNIFSAKMTYSHGCVIGFRETEFLSSRLPVLGAGSTIACEPGTKAIGARLGNGLSPSRGIFGEEPFPACQASRHPTASKQKCRKFRAFRRQRRASSSHLGRCAWPASLPLA